MRQSVLKEETVHQEFHNWQNCPSKIIGKLKYSKIKKKLRVLVPCRPDL
jgi:hypothetical protein